MKRREDEKRREEKGDRKRIGKKRNRNRDIDTR